MNKIQKFFAYFLIPVGYYCEGCPFWSLDKTHPQMQNGYCSYLGKGDWDIYNEHADKIEIQQRQPNGSFKAELADKEDLVPLSLLWDGCKECGRKLT